MLRLVDLDRVRKRLGVPPSDRASDPTILEGIDAAQLRIEGELETRLERASYLDVFNLDASIQGAQSHGQWVLRLRNGFVLNVTVDVVTSPWASAGEAVSADAFVVDPEKGFVYVSPEVSGFLRVSYDAGFTAVAEVPDWLADAIKAYVPTVMNFSNVFTRKDLTALTQLNIGHAMAVLAPHRRTAGMSLFPIR